ncbi:glycosyltransferase [bacterium]|nr:glycosyltransferase [bacterium]
MTANDSRRALIITDVTQPGGVDAYVLALRNAAHDAGWNVAVMLDDSPGADRLAVLLAGAGTGPARAPLYHRAHPEIVRTGATRAVMDRFDPRIVHAVCGAPWTTIIPREAAIARGLPLIFTEQYVAPNFTFDPAVRARIERLYRETHAVIAVSDENARLLTDEFAFPGERLRVIPNAVAPATAPRKPVPRTGDLVRVLCVARLTPQKGVDVLLHALSTIDVDTRSRLRVTCAGDGPDADILRTLADELGVAPLVEFAGWRDDVPALIANADLFVLPSRAEGQPFALLEALAAGVPVIATNVSGIPAALDGGRLGALVPPDDASALAAAIANFARDPEPLRRAASHGPAHIAQRHSLADAMAETLAIWDDATGAPPRAENA